MQREQYVCVIDDDDPVRMVARQLLESGGIKVRDFESAQEFLSHYKEAEISCVVTDLRMPGMDGNELLDRLQSLGSQASIVVLSAHADVRSAVRLMESGALTLLEKPYEPAELLAAVTRGIQRTAERRALHESVQRTRESLAELSAEERAVVDGIVAGLPNKAIALKLDISTRTVDRRRQAVFGKMGIGSPAELAAQIAQLSALDQR